ncbi:AraC family transcriptional regulator [Streptomyces spiroverticillatus]|uniref:AraC family transcriptional regulator n=1 Tax=Streptomyces finlayi TaxID=67296 RepID=A0A918WRV5_9ACTN|nr:helix-turn-helix domain-containing protein [Streptomyces finlayi]GGZ84721.1 AraC family transcriptional regulator [Streptomyces spiroverticillatus]GHC76476.1 AraC family transcriptional regulator [Streptomyces finlayi]
MYVYQDPSSGGEWACAAPCPRLSPGVVRYRGYRLALDAPRRRLELPTATVALVLNFEHELLLSDAVRSPDARQGPEVARAHRSLVSGLRTSATVGEHGGRLCGMEIVLAPWAAFTLFGTTLQGCSERIVDAGELLGRRFDELLESLAGLPGWAERFQRLDTVLTSWADGGPGCPPQVMWAWDQLVGTSGRVRIGQVAEATGWGPRQFENRFRQHIGVPPKSAARILRLQRALGLLARGIPPVEAAGTAGFYDQAHLTREVTAMTGRPPTRLLAARRAAPPGAGARDRLDGHVTSVLLPA